MNGAVLASLTRVRNRLGQRLRGSLGTAQLRRRFGALERAQRYQAVASLSDRYSRGATATPADLRLSELKVFSQNGEDGVICALVSLLGVAEEFFVEFGVEDGAECNTRFLAEVLGWSGAYFEINTEACARLSRRYANTHRISVTNVAVTAANIGELFDGCHVPRFFGVLSIDVDGQDIWLWRSLSAEYRPAIVVIEYNAGLDREASLSEPFGAHPLYTSAFGASLGALDVVAREKGYRLVHTEMAGVNAFYVRDDLSVTESIRGIADRSPNYGLSGSGHAADRSGRGFVEVCATNRILRSRSPWGRDQRK